MPEKMTKNEIVKHILRRNDTWKTERKPWESLWNMAMEFIAPQHGSMLESGIRQQGEKRGQLMYDGTPERAKDIMVAGMYSGLVPDNYQWFIWTFLPLFLNKEPNAKRWIDRSRETCYYAINDSNYGDVTFQAFEQQVSFGTSVKYSEKDDHKIFNSEIVRLNECVFDESPRGIVDTLIRELKLSVRNAIAEWGYDRMPEQIRNTYDSGRLDDEYEFVHAVFPRKDYDPKYLDKLNMPWASYWICPTALEDEQLLEEGGYRNFPYSVTRMYKQPGEKYGRGPAIKCLQAMGVLNKMARTNLIGGQRAVFPPFQIPDDGFPKALDLRPDAQNYYEVARGEIKPILTGLNIPFGLDLQQRQEQAVEKYFGVDVFLAITNSETTMTATEALERKQEKLMLMGPTIGRQKREHLDSDLDRFFSILYENGYLEKPPDVVLEQMQRMDTEYTSPLFLAQRRRDKESIITTIQECSLIAQATGDPSILDNFDPDEAYHIVSDRNLLPSEVTRRPEMVQQIRQARQQKQMAMEQAQAGMAAVQAAQQLGSIGTHPDQPNVLTDLVQGMTRQ